MGGARPGGNLHLACDGIGNTIRGGLQPSPSDCKGKVRDDELNKGPQPGQPVALSGHLSPLL